MAATGVGAGRIGVRAQGILVFCLSTVLLTVQDALTKLLTDTYSPVEALFYRGGAALIPVAVIVAFSGGWRRLRSARPMTNLARGIISLATSILVVWSIKLLPLAEALAIIFINPLIVAALSGPVLGERVSLRQWGAVAVGFTGALLIIRPSGGAPLDWSVLVPIGAAFLGAARDLLTRYLGASDHPSTVLFYTMVVMFLGSAVPVGWSGTHAPSIGEWWLILAAAVLVTGAYWCQIIGFKLAAAAVIAPYKYLSLVWAGLLGWAIWGDVMEPVKAAGCLLVVASGLYLLRAETARA